MKKLLILASLFLCNMVCASDLQISSIRLSKNGTEVGVMICGNQSCDMARRNESNYLDDMNVVDGKSIRKGKFYTSQINVVLIKDIKKEFLRVTYSEEEGEGLFDESHNLISDFVIGNRKRDLKTVIEVPLVYKTKSYEVKLDSMTDITVNLNELF